MMKWPVSALMHEARELVREEARAKSIGIVVVGVEDEVAISRAPVVEIVGALLRDAVRAAPPGGRVAVTGQQIERELVFAVYDTGTSSRPFDERAIETAHALGGRLWTANRADGRLALFSIPLCHGSARAPLYWA